MISRDSWIIRRVVTHPVTEDGRCSDPFIRKWVQIMGSSARYMVFKSVTYLQCSNFGCIFHTNAFTCVLGASIVLVINVVFYLPLFNNHTWNNEIYFQALHLNISAVFYVNFQLMWPADCNLYSVGISICRLNFYHEYCLIGFCHVIFPRLQLRLRSPAALLGAAGCRWQRAGCRWCSGCGCRSQH